MTSQKASENTSNKYQLMVNLFKKGIPFSLVDDFHKVLNHMKCKPKSTPPKAFLEYRKQKELKQGYDLPPSFWARTDISEYINAMTALQADRDSDIYWIKECLKLISDSDPRRQDFTLKLQELEAVIYFKKSAKGSKIVTGSETGLSSHINADDVNWEE